MKAWNASRTSNPQGADFKEIPINGKISWLEFTIKPTSKFWRAGFKLHDPNASIFPLPSSQSLLFHLGSTTSNEEYGFTAYHNGIWIKELNKTKRYPPDKELKVRLEINHNNFLKVLVNNSIEFKPQWHLDNPNIREKVVLLAWGDDNDYNVEFKNITFGNWKEFKKIQNFNIKSLLTSIRSFFGELTNPQKFIGAIVVGIIILIFGHLMFPNNNEKSSPNPNIIPTLPTETQYTSPTYKPSPIDDETIISTGESYTDPNSKIVIGLLDVIVGNKANIAITYPGADTKTYTDVIPGKVIYFTTNTNRFSIIIKSINYIGNYIKIILRSE
jgi:hypothetical protein